MHVPVLLAESLEYLSLRRQGVYVDATCGLGGHTGAIARQLEDGCVIASDRDNDSLAMARRTLEEQLAVEETARIRFSWGTFSTLPERLREMGVERVSGVLADLGVSRMQLTEPARGFTFQAEGPLDMRMDRSEGPTAADLVNHLSERDIADLIYEYGEERRSRQIARAIVRARPLKTTLDLAEVVARAAPRTERIHPATRTFMALRIAVNRELDEVDALLEGMPDLLEPGGRMVVISFHSLEDRRVKQRFQALAREGRAKVLTRHVVTPGAGEVESNPAARSAKLRAIEKL